MSRRDRLATKAAKRRATDKLAALKQQAVRQDLKIDSWLAHIADLMLECCDADDLTPSRENILREVKKTDVEKHIVDAVTRAKWRNATAESAIDDFLSLATEKAEVRAGRGGHGRMLRPFKSVTEFDIAKARVLLDKAERGATPIEDILDTLGLYGAQMTHSDLSDASMTEAVDTGGHLVQLVNKIVTPAFFERLVATAWHNVTKENVEAELLRDIGNRADLYIAIMYVHAAADQKAAAGTGPSPNPPDPRKIGLDATFSLATDSTLQVVRDILAGVHWRDADGEEDVDLRFGRLVEERARAIQRGDLDFATEAILRLLPKDKQKIAEETYGKRYEAEYQATKKGLPVEGRIHSPTVDDYNRDAKRKAIEALVERVVKMNAPFVREQIDSGQIDVADLTKKMHVRMVVGAKDDGEQEDDWPHVRESLITAGWKGATAETTDTLMAKELLEAAKKLEIEKVADLDKQIAALDAVGRGPMGPGRWGSPKQFDEFLMTQGAVVWGETYRRGMSDEATRARISQENLLPPDGSSWGRDESLSMVHFCAKWAVHAFQRIQTSHTFAASMMATSTYPELMDDLEVPWGAFMVHVPPGILRVVTEKYPRGTEFNRILVANYSFGAELHLFDSIMPPGDGGWMVLKDENLTKLLFDEAEASVKTPTDRAGLLAKRLVVNLLFALQDKGNVKEKTVKATRAFRDGVRHEEPEHRIVIIGHPLTVDCREAIASYLEKGEYVRRVADPSSADPDGEPSETRQRKPPQVQWLVRGHRRRQVCGVGRLQRKIIFVESFWKGKEGAPILTKPKRVIGKPPGSTPTSGAPSEGAA
jgi:hypothetical protein